MLAERTTPRTSGAPPTHGVRVFCDQLIETLRLSESRSEAINASAVMHGDEMMRNGFTVAHVVHQYGNICQVITELALELKVAISVAEFHTLSRCLDDAIAQAVTEYGRLRERAILAEGMERFGALTHELRNHLATASLSFEVLRSGGLAFSGATGSLLEHSLARLHRLVERSVAEVRSDSTVERFEQAASDDAIDEAEPAAAPSKRRPGGQHAT